MADSQQAATGAVWSREFLADFLSLYRQLPCLYDPRHPAYSNKRLRERAYGALVTKMREVDPGARKDDVVKKINNMRSSYRKEAKKRDRWRARAENEGRRYEPSLWYFGLLDFLYDRDGPVMNGDEELLMNIKLEGDEYESSWPDVDTVLLENGPDSPRSISNESTNISIKRRRLEASQEAQASQEVQALYNPRPQQATSYESYLHFGAHIASELSMLQPMVATHCQKLINDCIYEAKCGNLSRASKLVTGHEEESL